MYDGNKIIIGLVIFGLLILSPILYNTIGKASVPPEPDINTPEINKMIEKNVICPRSIGICARDFILLSKEEESAFGYKQND